MDFLKKAADSLGNQQGGNNNNQNQNNDNNNNNQQQQGGDNNNQNNNQNNQNNNNDQQEDYLDKGFDAISKKTGHTFDRQTSEKITDGAREGFEKLTGKKVPEKFSN
ncbi:hypothetical protein Golomagni_07060 [Golovinomyces magnicellulatus]|nr:hypothetical protein Golomagni_07060 [Golovinomyces magnicellulatus]